MAFDDNDFMFDDDSDQVGPIDDLTLLTAWRTHSLRWIRARSSALKNLLIRKTEFDEPSSRALLTRAIADNAEAQLAVADLLSNNAGDVAYSWAALAACSGLAPAQALLALRLANLPPTNRRTQLLALQYARTYQLRRHSCAMKGRRQAWLEHLCDGIPRPENPAPVPAPPKKAESAVASDQPTLLVVEEIPLARGGNEDKAIVKTWEPLTAPLPLRAGPDPDVLETVLLEEFPWLAEVITLIVSDLRFRTEAGEPWLHWRPTLLVGPPGTGKTRLARRIAEICAVGFGEVSAAGSSDNRLLQGTARGWSTAQPTQVLNVIRQSRCANPIMLVDEIDKCEPDGRNGDIRQTLLGMLEPQSARAWPDECLMAPCDLSAVNWIICCNDLENLRGPLLSRLRIIGAPAPGSQHADTILAGLRRDIAAELRVRPDDLPELPIAFEDTLIDGLARGINVRRLRAGYEAALRMLLDQRVRVLH